jgi:dihydroflavonol-4-reductase
MILVTGGTGHIGNVLVKELLARGEQVRVLVLPNEDRSPLEGCAVEWVEGNVLDQATLEQAAQGVDVIYHLAGIISISPGQDEMVNRVNVDGTRNLLNAALFQKVRRIIYTSSIHAITRPPHGTTITETLPFDPENEAGEYDRSKARGSLEVLKAVSRGQDCVIVCPTGVIGPYDYRLSEIGKLILDTASGKTQYEIDGAYDFVDVRDVVDGMILACEKGRTGESYILGGERITVREIYDTIIEVTGIRRNRVKIPKRVARFAAHLALPWYRLTRSKPVFTPYSLETVFSNSDISTQKARLELGYSPRSLKGSISDAIDWFKLHKPGLLGKKKHK